MPTKTYAGTDVTFETFYGPLSAHGVWVYVPGYGRVWRPYVNDLRDPFLYDEPWAWATYHYGRWDFTDEHGWYWVPQIQWAPAWVSWHEGGGYVGWAPMGPAYVTNYAPSYTFVETAHFVGKGHLQGTSARDTCKGYLPGTFGRDPLDAIPVACRRRRSDRSWAPAANDPASDRYRRKCRA